MRDFLSNIVEHRVTICRMQSYIQVHFRTLIKCTTKCHNIHDPLQNEKNRLLAKI